MRCLVIPPQHHDKFPIDLGNCRVALVENIDGDMCLTRKAYEWGKFQYRLNLDEYASQREFFKTVNQWIKNQIELGNDIEFIPKINTI